ncbi:penicillin-binding protein activator LpoB [Zobellella maritima]|uniref:penicillin-binding protein activator LpoB n=1 Tax=Zobellella maritima TaxID=2059725 RepID=UPI000E30940F|nr:penicillin-binding protein activator LpoB [Zobellella maritima]
MKLLHVFPLLLAAVLTACTLPDPYSRQPAPVTPVTPQPPSPPPPPTVDVPPPVRPPLMIPGEPVSPVTIPDAPTMPAPPASNQALARLADNLASRLKSSPQINEVQGAVLLDDIRNQVGSPMDTRALTQRLQANLSSRLSFVDGDKVSNLRQQLAYQSGRADMAALVSLGKQSGASYLLSGSLNRAGAGFTLSAQLMDLRSGELLWSDKVSGQ